MMKSPKKKKNQPLLKLRILRVKKEDKEAEVAVEYHSGFNNKHLPLVLEAILLKIGQVNGEDLDSTVQRLVKLTPRCRGQIETAH